MNKEVITELKAGTVTEQKAELLQQMQLISTQLFELVDNMKKDIGENENKRDN